MDFVEIDILCKEDLKDILTAELCQMGYESFLETSNGFKAYQPEKNHNPAMLSELQQRYVLNTSFKYRKLADKNWNEVWEKSFEPIEIDGKCRIRASFHPAKNSLPFEIIIDPKMSFGTGHHETTRQMLSCQLSLDHSGKSILDIGCGTGILSILGEKKGAEQILGLDIDPHAVSNTVKNMVLNNCRKIKVKEGTVKDLPSNRTFDMILANINRNVLLEEIDLYHQHLSNSGLLIISGFYTWDSPEIVKKCEASTFKIKEQTEENQWACLLLEKN